MQEISNLRELLIHQIQEIHTVERQMLLLLPRMIEIAHDRGLRSVLERHRQECALHLQRTNEAVDFLKQKASEDRCQAVAGLIAAADTLLRQIDNDGVRDTALAIIAHKLQNHELASLNTAKSMAQTLGHPKLVILFQKSIEEGNEISRKLIDSKRKELHKKALVGL